MGMADIAITPANFHPSAGVNPVRGVAAVAITAGQVVCMNADQSIGLADANAPAPANLPIGIAVCSAAGAGQIIMYATSDTDMTLGGTTISGTVYILSGTPGGICPAADLATGMFTSIIGVGKTGNKLWMQLVASGQSF